MTAQKADWTDYAQRLADSLRERGDVRSTEWHKAVAVVPRHLLVPLAYDQDKTGQWTAFDTAHALERVYSTETLITSVENVDGNQIPISSSTKPDLMVRMLEILDVRDGHRVLEIGTGTGYNAALLCHRVGEARVFSVDVDADLIELARERLATVGYRPTLRAVDGVNGLAEHAPFDRIIATCSVPAVPWSWADQLAADGAILVDLKLATSAGNLVHLRRCGGRLEGRFTARWAAFMAMRHAGQLAPEPAEKALDDRERFTETPAVPWNDAPVVWFLAQLQLPRGVVQGFELDDVTRQPTATTLSAPDGSWARVGLADRRVTEAGRTQLWAAIESAHRSWDVLGRPSWDRFGLSVTAAGEHVVWLDAPDGERCWTLPTTALRGVAPRPASLRSRQASP